MSMADLVNGIFELGGGILLVQNCRLLYRDKCVKGVSVSVTAFFAAWGVWNLFYYPHLGQWASFAGGLVIVAANLVWVGMAVYYARLFKADVARLERYLRSPTGQEKLTIENFDLDDIAAPTCPVTGLPKDH